MTTTFTAKPMKITKSTMRFFFTCGMVSPLCSQGNNLAQDYPISGETSIDRDKNSDFFNG
jgi:hypothetical protein